MHKSKEYDYFEYQICGHYLSALINGDESAFNADDDAAFSAFMDSMPDVYNGFWDVIDDEPSFSTDDVTGLAADCYACRYYFEV